MKPEMRDRNYLQGIAELEADSAPFEIDGRQLEVPLPVVPVPGGSVIRLCDVKAKPIRWLWDGHIPHGSMTLVIGDPGLGKSQLTLDIAARVSRGTPWPDNARCELGNVLLIASEDSVERTLMTRLQASGADLARVSVLDTIDAGGGKQRMFNLAEDLAFLEQMIVDNHIEMVVIDPLNGYLGNANAWKESEVRNILAPACKIADRHDVVLLGVMHLNKDNTRSAIHRVIGSVAFGAVTRSMFAVAPHPQYASIRYFVSVKQNYAKQPPTKAFVIGDGSGLTWDGKDYPDVTADSLLAITGAPEDKAERRNARAWLYATLEMGPVKTQDIVRLAKRAAITDRSLHKAKYDLRVKSVKVAVPGVLGGGHWEWRLP